MLYIQHGKKWLQLPTNWLKNILSVQHKQYLANAEQVGQF